MTILKIDIHESAKLDIQLHLECFYCGISTDVFALLDVNMRIELISEIIEKVLVDPTGSNFNYETNCTSCGENIKVNSIEF